MIQVWRTLARAGTHRRRVKWKAINPNTLPPKLLLGTRNAAGDWISGAVANVVRELQDSSTAECRSASVWCYLVVILEHYGQGCSPTCMLRFTCDTWALYRWIVLDGEAVPDWLAVLAAALDGERVLRREHPVVQGLFLA
jgi:hypothetical protein